MESAALVRPASTKRASNLLSCGIPGSGAIGGFDHAHLAETFPSPVIQLELVQHKRRTALLLRSQWKSTLGLDCDPSPLSEEPSFLLKQRLRSPSGSASTTCAPNVRVTPRALSTPAQCLVTRTPEPLRRSTDGAQSESIRLAEWHKRPVMAQRHPEGWRMRFDYWRARQDSNPRPLGS